MNVEEKRARGLHIDPVSGLGPVRSFFRRMLVNFDLWRLRRANAKALAFEASLSEIDMACKQIAVRENANRG